MKLKISITPELKEALSEAEKLLAESFDCPVEIIQGFFKTSQIITGEFDLGFTSETGERLMLLKPGDRLREFLAALRAGDINSNVIG